MMQSPDQVEDEQWLSAEAAHILGDVESATTACRELADIEVRIHDNIEKAQMLMQKAAAELLSPQVQCHSAVEVIISDVQYYGYLLPSANLQDLAQAQRHLAYFASHESEDVWCPEYARKAVKEASNGLRDVVMLRIVLQQTDLRDVKEFDTLAADAYVLSRQTYFDEERCKLHQAYHKDAREAMRCICWTSTNAKSNEKRGCKRPPRRPRSQCDSSELRPAFVFVRPPLAQSPANHPPQPARIKGKPLKIVVRESLDTPSAEESNCQKPMQVEVSRDTAEEMRRMRFFTYNGKLCFL